MVVLDVDGVDISHCVINYNSFPAEGLTIPNNGTGGQKYNGVAYKNNYIPLLSGANGWAFENNSLDKITISSGAAVDNRRNITIEFLIYYQGVSSGASTVFFGFGGNELFSKGTGVSGCDLQVYIGADSNIYVGKATGTFMSGWYIWNSTTTKLVPNNWYFIQVAWVLGLVSGSAPVVYINGVLQSMHNQFVLNDIIQIIINLITETDFLTLCAQLVVDIIWAILEITIDIIMGITTGGAGWWGSLLGLGGSALGSLLDIVDAVIGLFSVGGALTLGDFTGVVNGVVNMIHAFESGNLVGTSGIIYDIFGILKDIYITIVSYPGGYTANWISDAGKPITLGNYSTNGYQVYGILALFRFWNAWLTSVQLTASYNASKWRAGFAIPETAYDVDGATTSYCTIEYIDTSFPASGTTITNVGTAGSAYDGIAHKNDYYAYPNGATGWVVASGASTDLITVPAGFFIDNASNLTVESLVYVSGANHATNMIWSKPDNNNRNFGLSYTTGYALTLQRYTTNANADTWVTASGVVQAGSWYFIQVVWAAGTGPGTTPIIYVNGVSKTLTHSATGTGSWPQDSAKNLTIMNISSGSDNVYGSLGLFRWHIAALDAVTCLANYEASKWRAYITVSGSKNQTTVPVVNAAVSTKPTIVSGALTNWDQTVVPNIAATQLSVSQGRTWNQFTIPDVATASIAPQLPFLQRGTLVVELTGVAASTVALIDYGDEEP